MSSLVTLATPKLASWQLSVLIIKAELCLQPKRCIYMSFLLWNLLWMFLCEFFNCPIKDNGFVCPNRRRAVTWTNDDHVHWWMDLKDQGPLSIKMPSYQYRDSHVKDETVSATVLSLTLENPRLGKTVFILRRGPGRQDLCRNTMSLHPNPVDPLILYSNPFRLSQLR